MKKSWGNLSYFFNNIKKYPIVYAFILSVIPIMIAICSRRYFIESIIASVGLTFTALKYRLDQANYNRELFEKRYEIFRTIDLVIWEWAHKLDVTKEMIDQLSDDVIRKAYYLFDEETYFFIKEIRTALINYKNVQKRNEVHEFLSSLVDHENLPKKFKSLNISEY